MMHRNFGIRASQRATGAHPPAGSPFATGERRNSNSFAALSPPDSDERDSGGFDRRLFITDDDRGLACAVFVAICAAMPAIFLCAVYVFLARG